MISVPPCPSLAATKDEAKYLSLLDPVMVMPLAALVALMKLLPSTALIEICTDIFRPALVSYVRSASASVTWLITCLIEAVTVPATRLPIVGPVGIIAPHKPDAVDQSQRLC